VNVYKLPADKAIDGIERAVTSEEKFQFINPEGEVETFGGTDFNDTEKLAEAGLIAFSHDVSPEYDEYNENLVPSYDMGEMIVTYTVVPRFTPEQQAENVRNQRDHLLSQSDWTQMPDSPLKGDVTWLTYRQSLRDITVQSGFPSDVEWPLKPGEGNDAPQ